MMEEQVEEAMFISDGNERGGNADHAGQMQPSMVSYQNETNTGCLKPSQSEEPVIYAETGFQMPDSANGRFLHSFRKRFEKKRLYALIMPIRGGKTELAKRLGSANGVIFVDIDEYMSLQLPEIFKSRLNAATAHENVHNATYLPVVKRYVERILIKFKNNKIILLMSDRTMAIHIGVPKDHIRAYVASNSCYNNYITSICQDDETAISLASKSREQVLYDFGTLTTIFDTFTELVSLITTLFNVRKKP
jgi:hypothetical protein